MVKSSSLSAFDKMNKAMTSAFEKSAKRAGLESDPDLRTYNMLNGDDFADLSKMFGQAEVIEYINEMERKQLLEK